MAFSKAFPRRSDKSVYPNWEDVYLTESEEKAVDEAARATNNKLFKECLQDARQIMIDEQLKDFETNLVRIAKSLFEKRASHTVFWKEEQAKDKFDAAQK